MRQNRTLTFFDTQFRRQIRAGEFVLNPFERLALPFLQGRVLDLGCGLGNLALEAARRGCPVTALDGSAAAIARLRETAAAESLPIEARKTDLSTHRIGETFDAIVCIGLLMFFEKGHALQMLREIQTHVRSGGHAIVNVLIEGTTYLDMFEPGRYYLFGRRELQESFASWKVLESRYDGFEAPGSTLKAFATVVAQRP